MRLRLRLPDKAALPSVQQAPSDLAAAVPYAQASA